MNKQHLETITDKLAISAKQIENTARLLEEGGYCALCFPI
ncbi:unnamed protein product [marine sediment metagenome]|uniref:Uncharacterized protein n=1 Tax=marine sediment metagenome TaxID=412755 RepID=X1QUE2_9ZZZZ